jgi:hypothetical protein
VARHSYGRPRRSVVASSVCRHRRDSLLDGACLREQLRPSHTRRRARPPAVHSRANRAGATAVLVPGRILDIPQGVLSGIRKLTSMIRDGPQGTGYTRTKRTARFPVNTRENSASRSVRQGPELARILDEVAGSNPVTPTRTPLANYRFPKGFVLCGEIRSLPSALSLPIQTRQHSPRGCRPRSSPIWGSRI